MWKRDDLMDLDKRSRGKGLTRKIIYLLVFGILIGGIIYLLPRFEWHAPVVRVTLVSKSVGSRPFDVEITERGTGLATVSVSLSAGGADHPLFAESYGPGTKEKKIRIALTPEKIGAKEGAAVLRITVRDRSYWRFFSGNQTIVQEDLVIDMTPPSLEIISDDRYINFGGSGLVTYKASTDTQKSGVRIANHFFPAYKMKEPGRYLAFFAQPYDSSENDRAVVVAEDGAGNAKQMALSYTVKGVRYKKSTLPVDDDFIERRVLPLLGVATAGDGGLKGAFLKVNRELRKKNEDRIKELCRQSIPRMLWEKPFHQLANSKVEANFADQRTYVYKGETIDHAYHLGYDLAVTKHTPIEAANDGIVVFAGDLGIYGNTIILDHGLGLFTLYSHLSSFDVRAGDKVGQRQIIGKTGETGMAAGDHLHYALLIHGVPVLPVEWWDGKWVKENVQGKLNGHAH